MGPIQIDLADGYMRVLLPTPVMSQLAFIVNPHLLDDKQLVVFYLSIPMGLVQVVPFTSVTETIVDIYKYITAYDMILKMSTHIN